MMRAVMLGEVRADAHSVVTVGTFDGVHLGHQALLRYVLGRARERGCRSTAVTFDPHPREIVHGERVRLLSTVDERAEVMGALGMDLLVVVPFTPSFAQMGAYQFVKDVLVERVGMQEIVIGYDFTFGHAREGDGKLLERLGAEFGFGVDVIPAQLLDTGVVSSSTVRNVLVEQGDVSRAASMLNRRYTLDALVVRGDTRGKKLGYPTANLRLIDGRKVVPKIGVYAVGVKIDQRDGFLPGMMNIGRRPTFGDGDVRLEVHILDFEGDLYEKRIRVAFVERVRDEKKFESVEALVEQLSRDENRCRALLEAVY